MRSHPDPGNVSRHNDGDFKERGVILGEFGYCDKEEHVVKSYQMQTNDVKHPLFHLIRFRRKASSPATQNCLGSASSASGGVTRLGGSITGLRVSTLNHHNGKANITTHGVLVAAFTRVETRGVGAVTIPSLERVEVGGRTRGIGVPGSVDDLLGVVVEKLTIELSHGSGKLHGARDTEGAGGEGIGRGHGSKESKSLGVLQSANERRRMLVRMLRSENKSPTIHYAIRRPCTPALYPASAHTKPHFHVP